MTDTLGEPCEVLSTDLTTTRRRWRRAAIVRRLLMILLVVGQTMVATWYMLSVLPYHGDTAIEKGLAALFGVLFAWISIGFWTAVSGFITRRFSGDRFSLLHRHPAGELAGVPLARTAVVMPIYHEHVNRSLGGLRAIYRSLARTGRLDSFDFYILSDSRDPEIWLAEQAAWGELVDELGAHGRLHYRRRPVNLRYKSGNIADFLRRWGRDYEYMVVLDADSAMGGETLVRMVQLMQLEPNTGILQTVPTLMNARSPFARVQQFANHAYGPLLGSGLAAITLGEATYWGHNAIIRTEPFIRHCGLRQLTGIGLFRGPILSHDFVEAACMGRAGFEVWMEPGLGESYEESPPSLVDELARDRRWAKGNLQHLWLMLFRPGIRFAHRMAFLNGVMSYLASPLWFAFLVLTTIETTRFVLWPIDYFPTGHTLFPLWPEWHPEWAISLAGSTLLLLFLPKLLAIVDIVLTRRTRDFGGIARLSVSVVAEIVISTMLAPIRMLAHTRYVLGALLNLSLAWAGQNRTDETGWATAFVTQAPGMVIALAWSAFAFWLKPLFFIWSLPVAIPLVLAAPTSVLLSRTALGDRLRGAGLLLVAEESRGSQLLDGLTARPLLTAQSTRHGNFELAVIDPRRNALHSALARHRNGNRGRNLRLLCKHCLAEGPGALTMRERSLLANDRQSLQWLHRQVWQSPPSSYWGRHLESLIVGQ